MSQELTDWFPADVAPVHIGVYEVDDMDGVYGTWYAFWNGKKFGFRSCSSEGAYKERNCRTLCSPFVMWRGLAVKP